MQMTPFIEKIEEFPDYRIVRLKGAVDSATIPDLENFRHQFRKRKDFQYKNVLIDLRQVTHVDSATIAELIDLLSNLKQSHHRLALIGAPENFKQMTQILKADQLFPIHATEEEALQAIHENTSDDTDR